MRARRNFVLFGFPVPRSFHTPTRDFNRTRNVVEPRRQTLSPAFDPPLFRECSWHFGSRDKYFQYGAFNPIFSTRGFPRWRTRTAITGDYARPTVSFGVMFSSSETPRRSNVDLQRDNVRYSQFQVTLLIKLDFLDRYGLAGWVEIIQRGRRDYFVKPYYLYLSFIIFICFYIVILVYCIMGYDISIQPEC
jgi:hypothetical protein